MATMWVCVVAAVLVVAVQQASTDGPCGDYEAILDKLQVCDGTESSIFTVDNLNVTLRDDCTIAASGSGAYQSFTTALVKYDIKITPTKSPFRSILQRWPFKGEIDACQLLKLIPKEFVAVLKSMDLATSCPVEAKTLNMTESMTSNLSELPNYKIFMELLAALGPTTGRISAVHDTGVSCLEFGGVFRKKEDVGLPPSTN